jgi:hypothetical protein
MYEFPRFSNFSKVLRQLSGNGVNQDLAQQPHEDYPFECVKHAVELRIECGKRE